MRIFFHQPTFDGQLLRLISDTYFGCADIGECLITASHIKEGDFESWHTEWDKIADRLYEEGTHFEADGHLISAREAYLRASNYYRAAMFFLYTTPVDEQIYGTLKKHTLSFSKAARLFNPPFEAVNIPFENATLPGYFYRSDNSGDRRPTIIWNGGYDSTNQEAYFSFVPAALRRGFNVLAFDGPGQGATLIQQNLPMRHNWESVITPVIDYLYTRADVDQSNIILYGVSWGGILVPRAAAYEHRPAAVIANPGQFDPMENIRRATHNESNEERNIDIDAFFQAAMQDKYVAAKFQAKMYIHGTDSPLELVEQLENYKLVDCAKLIRCPVLVADAENEHLSTGQAKKLFEALSCPKDYVLFTNIEGCGDHCGAGGLGIVLEKIFNWISSTLKLHTSDDAKEKSKPIELGYHTPK